MTELLPHECLRGSSVLRTADKGLELTGLYSMCVTILDCDVRFQARVLAMLAANRFKNGQSQA